MGVVLRSATVSLLGGWGWECTCLPPSMLCPELQNGHCQQPERQAAWPFRSKTLISPSVPFKGVCIAIHTRTSCCHPTCTAVFCSWAPGHRGAWRGPCLGWVWQSKAGAAADLTLCPTGCAPPPWSPGMGHRPFPRKLSSKKLRGRRSRAERSLGLGLFALSVAEPFRTELLKRRWLHSTCTWHIVGAE